MTFIDFLYDLASGPLVWVAFAVFVFGSLVRFAKLAELAKQKDTYVYEYWSWKNAFNSFLHWYIPFRTTNSRLNPAMTIATFCFHVGIIIVPLFLAAHVIMFEDAWDLDFWWTLPNQIADWATWVVVAAGAYFVYRRIFLPQVRFVTGAKEFVVLGIALAPFVTGIIAYHQWFDPKWMLTLHILSGEVWLAAVPFTWLVHAVFGLFVRGYTASEFQGVRHVNDW